MKIEDYKASGVSTAYDVVKESIRYNLIASYIGSVICVLIILTLLFFSFKLYKIKFEKTYDRPIFHEMIWFLTLFIVPFMAIQIGKNIETMLQINFAPKNYIIKNFK